MGKITMENTNDMNSLVDFSPADIIALLFSKLNSREKEVLNRRYGIGNDRDTLEKIGKDFGVTRERVRQIEIGSIKKLKKLDDFDSTLSCVDKVLCNLIQNHGGIMQQDYLLEKLEECPGDHNTNKGAVRFMISKLLDDQLSSVENHDVLHNSWKLQDVNHDDCVKKIKNISGILDDHSEPLDESELYDIYHQDQSNEILKNQDVFQSHLRISKDLDRNIFDQWGKSNWSTIKPKRMNDKIYIVLKKHKEPLHFSAIADMINEMKFDHKIAYPATVHNELILDKKYVLVGRGIYALSEWGYKHGVVADVIEDVMRSEGRPLSREEIVEKVLNQRLVGKTTIHLSLMNKDRFQRLGDGRYTIK